MGATKCYALSSFPSLLPKQSLLSWRSRGLRVVRAKLSEPNARRANLSARKKEGILVPSYNKSGAGNMEFHISEFLNHPAGVEAILNTGALQKFQPLDCNMYRCVLPQIQFLNFEVAPVLDLQVKSTKEDCIVEMLSCKFEGSDLMEDQNDRFSAFMRNHITWETVDSGSLLNVDVKLNVTLEIAQFGDVINETPDSVYIDPSRHACKIYTYPFTWLPESAVESPGNLMMQALVDRLVPLHVQQLLTDYDKWVRSQQKSLQ